jgi:lipoate-protein ligase A
MTVRPFRLDRFAGSPGDFHALDLLAVPEPLVLVCDADRAAVVLGSSQRPEVVDGPAAVAAGVDVVRRRSGGGAVLVEPGAMCWFDVVVPADDPRFADVAGDVVASMVRVGRQIDAALTALGVGGTTVHDGPMVGTPWSRLVCFAGVGGGEVLTPAGKLVGISQRRRRTGARFQCMVHTMWNPARLLGVLTAPRPQVADLPPVATVAVDVAAALPAAVAAALSA